MSAENHADLIAEAEARLTGPRLGRSMAREADKDLVVIKRLVDALKLATPAVAHYDAFGPWAHLYSIEAMREPGFIPTFCQGCNIPVTPEGFGPQHCGFCPPWDCPDCGGKDSMATPCSCWVPLEGKNIADLKAIFAADGTFSIDPKPTDSTKEADHG